MKFGVEPAYGSDAARITSVESDIGSGSYACDATRITLAEFDIGVGHHASVAARNTPTESGISGGPHASGTARTTFAESGIGGGYQLTGELHLFLYIEASTNPLPSGYAFNAASPIAKLQHGYVNPLPKETLHHG